MSKSNRTCYFVNQKDLWTKDRPMPWWPSNKWSKTISHRIERAWVAKRLHHELVQLGYR